MKTCKKHRVGDVWICDSSGPLSDGDSIPDYEVDDVEVFNFCPTCGADLRNKDYIAPMVEKYKKERGK